MGIVMLFWTWIFYNHFTLQIEHIMLDLQG